MKKRVYRRVGVTLVELLVVMVIMIIFLAAVIQAFNIAFHSFQTNHRILASRNYHAQVDFLFEVLEKEIGYAGSMHSFLRHIDFQHPFSFDATSVSVSTDNSSITFQYAAVEKIVLASAEATAVGDAQPYNYYFSLFPADFPKWEDQPSERESWLILGSPSLSPSSVQKPSFEKIQTPYATTLVYIDPQHQHITYTVATITTQDPQGYDFLFMLLYDNRSNGFLGLRNAPLDPLFWGELVGKTEVSQSASVVTMKKEVPTPSGSLNLSMDLLREVDQISFFVDPVNNYIRADLVAIFPSYRHPIEITKTRYFWFFDDN